MEIFLIVIISLIAGSFFNVIIWRYPQILQNQWSAECEILLSQAQSKQQEINLHLPFSYCCHCQTPLKFWHNIPVISYLLLKGRCGHCKQRISLRYPIVEISAVLFAVFCIIKFGLTPVAVAAIVFSWLLLLLTIIDINTQLLPDTLTLGLLWLGLLINTQEIFTQLSNAVLASTVAYLSLWLFAKLFKKITGKDGMGYGDFKLFAALGAWLGLNSLLNIIVIASISGLLINLLLLILRKTKWQQPLSFGPYLALGGWLTLFFGSFTIGLK